MYHTDSQDTHTEDPCTRKRNVNLNRAGNDITTTYLERKSTVRNMYGPVTNVAIVVWNCEELVTQINRVRSHSLPMNVNWSKVFLEPGLSI